MNPPPTSLPTTSLWVIPMHQPQACCTLCQTWTGDSILTWQYTCYNSHSPKSSHPLTLPLSPKVRYTHLCLFACLAYRVVIAIFQIFKKSIRHISPSELLKLYLGDKLWKPHFTSERLMLLLLSCVKYKTLKLLDYG